MHKLASGANGFEHDSKKIEIAAFEIAAPFCFTALRAVFDESVTKEALPVHGCDAVANAV